MKFLYGYKTKSNETREGAIDAPSRDDVYRELKQKGIRPFKVELAPGLANRLRSLGKRTYAIVILSVALVIALVLALHSTLFAFHSAVSAQPRHQIYGDPALMDELARGDYAAVFSHPGHRFLAHYAQPGAMPPRTALAAAADPKLPAALRDCQTAPIAFVDGEPREHNELKRIVLSMCEELGRYLANGIGTPERYVRRLNERQNREAQIYFTAKHDLEKETDLAKWERINASLRAIGLKTIPPPEK